LRPRPFIVTMTATPEFTKVSVIRPTNVAVMEQEDVKTQANANVHTDKPKEKVVSATPATMGVGTM